MTPTTYFINGRAVAQQAFVAKLASLEVATVFREGEMVDGFVQTYQARERATGKRCLYILRTDSRGTEHRISPVSGDADD
jgi:hypothetical protein